VWYRARIRGCRCDEDGDRR